MQSKTDEELFEILASHSSTYTREASEAASAESTSRKLKAPNQLDRSAAIANAGTSGKWTKIKVSRKDYRFPTCCPDCLGNGPFIPLSVRSDEEKLKGFYLIVRRYEYIRVPVPFCSKCAARQLRRTKVGQVLVVASLIASVAISVWLDLGRIGGFLLVVAVGGPALWFMDYRGRAVRVSEYDEDSVTFSFRRTEYAIQFITINHRCAVPVARTGA